MPPAEVKWSGLATGGGKVPVIAFIGRLVEIVEDPRTYGLYLVEKYDQVQILESPVPWPWATVDVPIKYSDRENSGWGHHVASAKLLGLAVAATTLAEAKADLVGKMYEMRQSAQSYGENQAGQPMTGDVWRFIRIAMPGQAQQFPQPQYAVPPAGGVPGAQPIAPAPVPAAVPPVQAAPPVAPVPPPAPVPPAVVTPPPPAVVFDTTPLPTDTAAVRAKKLLSGKALNEWLGVALIDDIIKADAGFINSIYDQSFIVGLKGSNQAVQGADGKFQITG